jgi:predicted PurR-regulated permease PerM
MRLQSKWSLPVRYLVAGILFILIAIAIWTIRSILEPLIIAGFIAYLIYPAVNYLTKRTRLKRAASVNLVYFITLAVFIGTPSTLTPLFFDEFTQVFTDLSNSFNNLIGWLENLHTLSGLPIDLSQLGNQLAQFRTTFLSSLPDQAIALLGKTSMGALWAIVILVAVYYFLSQWPRIHEGFIQSFPEDYQPEIEELYHRLCDIWVNYLRGQLLLMAIVGVVFSIAWTLIGLPGALALGVAAGFLTIIPDVGPFLAVSLAVFVAMLEGSNWSWMPSTNWVVALIVIATYVVLISIKNFWLRPFIMGRSVHMHEAVVLVSILLSTILWGILGALLIVPVLASLIVIFDYLRRRILGLPPFPPTEAFILNEPPVSGKEKIAAIKTKLSKKKV